MSRNRSGERKRGHADQLARIALAPLVNSGEAECWRCGQLIDPLQPWDAGHLDDLGRGGDPNGPRVPEHAYCNRKAGGELAAELRRGVRIRARRWFT